jgi:hypothetical protein
MEIFKNSRGHFFGILIPGLFLTINIYFFYPQLLNEIGIKSNLAIMSKDSVAIIIFFVLSYVLGVGLRLIKPSFLERLAIIPYFPLIVLEYLWQRIIRLFTKENKDVRIIESIGRRTYYYWQIFPYKEWFFSYYIKSASKTYKQFYKEILKNEFNNSFESIDKHFINHCKTYIYENSEGLSEEIMYNEGLSRFISGILYSLMISLTTIIAFSNSSQNILICYIIMFVFFLLQLKRIRIKEVLSIYDGYMFLKTKQ